MTIKTFWTILLKILGLWFAFMGLAIAVPTLSMLIYSSLNGPSPGIEKLLIAIVIVLVAFVIFILIVWLLVFKTVWVIEKLRLTKGFTEEKLDLTMEWTTILKIATIVIGGVIFIDSFPMLFKQILSYIQLGKPFRNNPESIWIFFYLVKTLLGYLLMTNSRMVVHFIGKQNDKNRENPTDNLSAEA
jgi:hypothetical protein